MINQNVDLPKYSPIPISMDHYFYEHALDGFGFLYTDLNTEF